MHIDIKHLPKLQTGDRDGRKRSLFVAIDRRSRSVHLAVKDDETEKSAIALLRKAAGAFPFRLTHVLIDNGSCFTPAFGRACAAPGAQYRRTRPRTPQTDGLVERFNGRISSEVLAINADSHRALEQLLRGFNAAYNARRQRILDGRTPDQIVAERLEAEPERAIPHPRRAQARVMPPRHASLPTAPRRSHTRQLDAASGAIHLIWFGHILKV